MRAASSSELRVAIIGLGPKGTFALERLFSRAAERAPGYSGRIIVDAFEAARTPGAGPVYDPRQPGYLRMNFAADQIDMWPPGGAGATAGSGQSFQAWAASVGMECAGETYPSRSQVGRYLSDGLGTLRRQCPPGIVFTLQPVRVEGLRRNAAGWKVSAGRAGGVYDEVLLATGHESAWSDALALDWHHSADLVPAVFPVDQQLAEPRVEPGSTVAARGFALTFIDAALALTEGRGGRFEALDHPYRLRYVPGHREPRAILPFSRSGRPMLAKPAPSVAAAIPDLASITESASGHILSAEALCGPEMELTSALDFAAVASLAAAGGVACQGTVPQTSDPVAAELEASLAVGAGLAPPDLPWARGHVWRSVYPALVRRLEADPLSAADWTRFRVVAAEMERIAFGPSPQNAAKLLALIEAGYVQLDHVRGSRIVNQDGVTFLRSSSRKTEVEAVVDAVLPAPGVRDIRSGLSLQLIRDGQARLADGRRGLDVLPDGRCRGRDGEITPGLSAIGRLTEDAIVGNDTLSRTLHPLADRWARRILTGLSVRRSARGCAAIPGKQPA